MTDTPAGAPASKPRVHELAKELGTTSKDVLAWFKDNDVAVKSASSTVPHDEADRLRAAFADGASAEPAPADVEAPAADAAAEPAADGEPTDPASPLAPAFAAPAAGADGAPAPRRRRRAGTTAAAAPAEIAAAVFVAPEVPAAPAKPARPARAAKPAVDGDEPAADALDEAEDQAEDQAGDRADDGDERGDGEARRRRRRGRRGRGPRRDDGDERAEGDDDDESRPARPAADPAAAEGSGAGQESDDDEDDDDEGGRGEAGSGTRRRRRRRRRGGAGGDDAGGDSEDPPGTVVHVRESSRADRRSGAGAADEDGVRGISGSTRMAAKRARRQEGRETSRRRPLLTEAEFLARREAVERVMVVRQRGDRTQIAVLEDGVLVEHYVTKASAQSYAGNVYLGRVQNVLPSMEAAFVDIGKGRNAVLYAGEVNYELLGAGGGGGPRKIESVLKSGQEVLVQVTKDPIGHKGARLTSQISLPGRYLVYVPEGSMTGISRKLPEKERARLKDVLRNVVPEGAGVIIRTAAEGVSEEEIAKDVRRLQAQWEVIQTKAKKGGAPVLLHAEPDLVIRVVRDIFNEDFTKLVVQGDSEWDTIRDYVEWVAPDLAPRLSRYTGEGDVFAEHRVDEQLAKGLDRKVWLPSGGSLVIDRTEAMVVIDVNTGKYVGKGGNLEETVTRNNLEAAEEIARQLRLRDLGGIIVVDFIDMVLESNRDLVVRRLVECMARDRTKHQVAEVTSLGLVQMTRKRVGQGLLESFSEPCEHCGGRGYHVRSEPVERRSERPERGDERRGRDKRRDEGKGEGKGDSGGSGGKDRPAKDAKEPKDASPKDDAAVGADDEAGGEPRGRRRRRGGRGTGPASPPASAISPQDELAEILGAPADDAAFGGTGPAADDAVEDAGPSPAADAEVSPADATEDGRVDVPAEALPDLAEQPPSDLEDQPVVPVADPEPAADAPAAAGATAPRRRRRATSRPAGPPA